MRSPRIEDLRPSRLPANVLAALVGGGSAVLLILRLLVPRPVGVADNYDGTRLMCHLGVDVRVPSGTPRLRDYVYVRYYHLPHFSCDQHKLGAINLPDVPYRSSQVLLLYAGRVLTRVLGLHSYLDLRAVGIVCCLLIGGAIGLLYRFARLRHRYRMLLCAGVLLVVADTVFIDYAISPFSEIASIIGLLYMAVGIVLLAGPGKRIQWAGLAITGASGLFFATAKTQNYPAVVPLAVVLLIPALPVPVARLRGLDRLLRHRLAGLATVAVLVVGAGVVSGNQDQHTAQLTGTNFLSVTLLGTSPHPRQDLAEFKGPAWLADYAGTPAWCGPWKLQNGAEYKQFAKTLSHKKFLAFYLRHPGRVLPTLNHVAEYFYIPRATATLCSPGPHGRQVMVTPRLANYTRVGHTPRGLVDRRWTPVTSGLGLLRGGGLAVLLTLWLLPGIALFATRRRRVMRGAVAVVALMVTVAVTQFVVSAFGDGIDTAKHLNVAVLATALAWVFAAVETLAALLTRRGSAPAEAVADAPAGTGRRKKLSGAVSEAVSEPESAG